VVLYILVALVRLDEVETTGVPELHKRDVLQHQRFSGVAVVLQRSTRYHQKEEGKKKLFVADSRQ
jgi:hypothetical protein